MTPVREATERVLSTSKDRLQISTALTDQTRESVRRSHEAVERSRARMQQSIGCARTPQKSSPVRSASVPKASAATSMEVVSSRNISNEVVEMDGKHFVDCFLSNCVLEYSGHPVVLETTEFEGCRFRFKGEAALTLRFCECFELMNGSTKDYTVAPSPGLTTQRPN